VVYFNFERYLASFGFTISKIEALHFFIRERFMKKSLISFLFYLLFCVGISSSGIMACTFATDGGGTGSSGNGVLYLLDNFSDAVYVFDNAVNLTGTISPSRTLSGSQTLIQNPTVIAVDGQRDILYVADSTEQAILVFTSAHTANGNVAPLRKYPGVRRGGDMFYDSLNDSLYVTDILQNIIVAWDHVSLLSTGTAPSRTIVLNYQASGLVVDTQRNLLYVGNPSGRVVQMYNGALALSALVNPPTAANIFSDATQAFVNMNGFALNTENNILYVAESANPSIEIFNGVSVLASGAIAASSELEGSNTGLTVNMHKILIQDNSNTLWSIANNTLINLWTNAQQINTINGNTAPNQSLTISGATQIVGLDLDMTR